jgi:hypothetical protein
MVGSRTPAGVARGSDLRAAEKGANFRVYAPSFMAIFALFALAQVAVCFGRSFVE